MRSKPISCNSRPMTMLLFALLAAGGAEANPQPVPGPFLRFNLRSPGSASCTAASCEEIRNYSETTGDLVFQIYLDRTFDSPPTLSRVDLTLRWPPSWSWSGFDACSGASLIQAAGQDTAHLALVWDEPLDLSGLDPEQPLLLGEARLLATTEGEATLSDSRLDGDYVYVDQAGYVGVDCDRVSIPCGASYAVCDFLATPPELSLSIRPGEVDQDTLLVRHVSPQGVTCPVRYDSSEDWIHTDVDSVYEGTERVIVWVNPSFDAGDHTGRVTVTTSSLVRCVPILLHVEPFGPVESQTWGRIKSRYGSPDGR